MQASNRGESAFDVLLHSAPGVCALVGTLIYLVYSGWILLFHYDPQTESVIASILALLFCGAFSFYCWTTSKRQDLDLLIRRSWRAFAIAGLFYGLGEFFWFYYESLLSRSPFVSIADLFYLLYYPSLLAGVLFLPAAPAEKREKLLLWLDLAIIMTTTFTIMWYFVLAPITNNGLHGLKGIIAIAYPVGSVMVFGAILALLKRDLQRLAFWPVFFLGLAMMSMTVADALFAYFQVNEIPYAEAPLNILWVGSLLLLFIAVVCQNVFGQAGTVEVPSSHRASTLLRAAVLYVFPIIGIVLLLLVVNSGSMHGIRVQGVLIGTVLLFALVLTRQGVLLRENMQLYEETQYLANTDALTGIHNRFYSTNVLEAELDRSLRYNRPLSILLIDLDDFKKYNDSFGHLKGDEALKSIAKAMSSQIRNSDILGRFGGDEFLVILPETGPEGAQYTAEKISREISAMTLGGLSIGVTIGMATLSGKQSSEELLENADRHLYQIKHSRV